MDQIANLAVIGAGSWGTAVASLAAQACDTTLWARRAEVAEAISRDHRNPDYLTDFVIPARVSATESIEDAVSGADAVVVGVPSHGFRSVLEQAASLIASDVPVVSLTKGIEADTLMRMTEVVADVLVGHDPRRIGVLSGPNLAKEIMAGQPAATVVAMGDHEAARALQKAFMTPTFRVYTNPDVIGCEIAGACKNVMAIASGMVSGLQFGDNTRAALVTRSLAELARLGIAVGGHPLTFGGLAGVGDLVATCYSSQSRNYTVGYGLGAGRPLDEIITEMSMVAEGVKSTKGVLALAAKHSIEMPIAAEVGRVLYEGADPADSMMALMGRAATSEGHGLL